VQNQRNIILAILLCATLLFGWDALVSHFYPPPPPRPKPLVAAPAAPSSTAAKPTRDGGLTDSGDVALETTDLAAQLKVAGRVPIVAPGLTGSINPAGALIDDLTTPRHTATVDKSSGPERIFSPSGTPAQQFAEFGWAPTSGGSDANLPNAKTVWTVPAGARLTPQTPVTLSWTSPANQLFTITYAIDQDYMITAKQSVVNRAAAPLAARPFALINRTDRTASINVWNLHSGPIGSYDSSVNFHVGYTCATGIFAIFSSCLDVSKESVIPNAGKTDWLGFTDIYWMSALIPDPSGDVTSDFRSLGNSLYRADLLYQPAQIAPGQTFTRTTRLFAGAKDTDVLDRYEDTGIPKFGLSIDWGWFRWFEKPIFWLLKSLFHATGNFGVAIILLTVVVRGAMFPIAQRQFASMAAMRALQPKMKAIQARNKDDKQKAQQEIMALYKEEKVNPLAGCLPTFLQIPVFFALYKVLNLSIEMRHQPFVLWIRDLSAPDPLHIINLFGLLPFTPPSFLGIGLLALLLGGTMYVQFKLNPQTGTDPTQQQMMSIMPWVMMFVMAPFAAGLLIYWITSNLLTIAQQRYLYSRHPALKAQAAKG
jgi:YidC/Oxa1 family membrane protein insertase